MADVHEIPTHIGKWAIFKAVMASKKFWYLNNLTIAEASRLIDQWDNWLIEKKNSTSAVKLHINQATDQARMKKKQELKK